jgi:hypothetical protein
MAELDDIKKQISDLNKRIGELGGAFKTNIDAYISSFGNDITAANKALTEMQKIFSNLDTDVNYFYIALKNVSKELKGQSNYNKDITKSYSALSSIANKLKYDQDGIQTLSKKELQNLQKKVQIQQTDLTSFLERNEEAKKASDLQQKSLQKQLDYYFKIADKNKSLSKIQQKRADDVIDALYREQKINSKIVETNKEVKDLLGEQEFGIKKINSIIEERLAEEIKIQKTLGISGKIIDSIVSTLGKLGIDSSFFEGVKEDMREVAKTGTSWQVLMTGIKGLASGIGDALKDPVSQLYILYKVTKFFVNAALTANSQIVELGKSLGYATDEYRSQLVRIERSSNSLFVTTKNLAEAYGELVKTIGFAYEFSADQLETQIKLTKQIGLQADEAAQIQRYSVLTGQSSENTYKSFVKGLVAARNQLKVGIDFRAALAEAANLSGQLAANLGFNPERIAQAVVQVKALGLTFDQLKSATSSLLEFSSSIENELKAELLTGKQLNLERARAAALAGDQVALAEELAKNIGTAADFTRLNVLQQNALATSVGMTSDQLAETLRRREEAIASGKSLQQITDEEAQKALERTSIQDKFNNAVEKLQSLFGNLMAGPLGGFIDVLSGALSIVNSIGSALSFLATPLKAILSLYVGIKGVQLGLNIARGIEEAQMITKLGLMQGELTYAGLIEAMQGRGLTTKIALMGINAKILIQDRLKALAESLSVKNIIAQISKIPVLLGLKSAEAAIQTEIAGAAVVTAEATSFGAATAWILGGLAAVLAAMTMFKGDDIMSPPSGYGKRTLLSPEGSIALNDKDTVIAGTNLFNKNDTITPPKNTIQSSSNNQYFQEMANSINSMHNTLKQSVNKPSVAYINGEDAFAKRLGSNPYLGTSQNIDTAYQMA